LGRKEEGIKSYKRAISIEPTSLIAHLGLGAAFASDGMEREARLEAEEVLRIEPKFSLERYAKALAFKNQAARDWIVTVLHKAGLK
jgi:tetratricopeptide (TPR) repeat protein